VKQKWENIKLWLSRVFRQGELWHRTMVFFVLLAVATAAGVVLWNYFFFKPPATLEELYNLAQVTAYAIALVSAPAAAAIAYRAQRLKEVDATNSRFKEAVKSLSSKDIYVRVEGIYALERLGLNAPNANERQRVMEVLCGFLRTDLKYIEPKNGEKYTSLEKQIYHIAALEAIKRLRDKYAWLEVDLSQTDLGGTFFDGMDMRSANFSDANFCWAYLCGANLRWADLSGAKLYGADLSWADLRSAKLGGAKLYEADLTDAYIDGKTNLPDSVFEEYEVYDFLGDKCLRRKEKSE